MTDVDSIIRNNDKEMNPNKATPALLSLLSTIVEIMQLKDSNYINHSNSPIYIIRITTMMCVKNNVAAKFVVLASYQMSIKHV